MAERRMFCRDLVTADPFLDMPTSARCLYFTLSVVADDDGFVSAPKSVMRQCGVSQDDLSLLVTKGYIIPFDSGVIAIRHWRQNNYLRSDRYTITRHLEERAMLTLDASGAYAMAQPGDPPVPTPGQKPATPTPGIPPCLPPGIPTVDQPAPTLDTQYSIGKDSIDKGSKGKGSEGKKEDPFVVFAGMNIELLDALKSFTEMRKALKKPLTDRAKQLQLTELQKLSTDPVTQVAIINQSIARGWQSFYGLKAAGGGNGGKPSGPNYDYSNTEGSF